MTADTEKCMIYALAVYDTTAKTQLSNQTLQGLFLPMTDPAKTMKAPRLFTVDFIFHTVVFGVVGLYSVMVIFCG